MESEFTTSLSLAAQNIINCFVNDDKSEVYENWKSLVSTLNRYIKYSAIPHIPNVPLAMFLYVMKYTSKRAEENSIRAISTFGVIMNAIENTEGEEKLDYLALLSPLLTYYKKYFKNVDNYSLFPITVPKKTETFNQTIIDWGNTNNVFDSIFLYIYDQIDIDSQPFFGNEEIRNKFISSKNAFFDEYNQKQQESDGILDGERALIDCYDRMNQVGKCPIYVPSDANNEINNKTYGLIPHKISFSVIKYFLHETSGPMSEGELNSQIMFDIQEGFINISCIGINEQYLKNEFSLPVRECRVRKIEQYIEMLFDTKAYRDTNHKYGNVDNIPMAMELHFEHFKLSEISLDFIVGDQGSMRTIHLYGYASK